MKSPAVIAVCLLPLALSGCVVPHKTEKMEPQQKMAPPVEDAPPPKPVPSPTDLPPTVITEPAQRTAQAQPPAESTPEQPKPPVHHHKPPANSTQVAQNTTPGVSAVGQLSSGADSDQRQQAEDSIASTERGLNGIGRSLSDQEKRTATQIREYLKQARAALGSGDVDGARTLASKAKVLLGELVK